MTEREHVRQDLIEQLKSNRVYGSHFYDLIDQYMRFWDTDKELTEIIIENGNMTMTNTGYKVHPAVEARNKNSTQMLKIIGTLGINVKSLSSASGGEEVEKTEDI